MSVTLHCNVALRRRPRFCLSPHTAPTFPERSFPSVPGVQSWNPTDTSHTDTLTRHLPFTAALLPHLSPVLPRFPGAACSAVKVTEAHADKYSNSYRPQEKWASFHNSSSPLCTILLYWPISCCRLQQSKLKQHRSNYMCINFKKFGACVCTITTRISWLAELWG